MTKTMCVLFDSREILINKLNVKTNDTPMRVKLAAVRAITFNVSALFVWNAPTGRLLIIPILRIWKVKRKPVSGVQRLNIVPVGRFDSIWMFTFNFILDFVNENIAIFMCSRCRWKRINHRNSSTLEITNRTKTPFKLIPSKQVVVEAIEALALEWAYL